MYIMVKSMAGAETAGAKTGGMVDGEGSITMPRVAKNPPTDFGHRLRRLRKERGFTQTELGAAIGSSHRMIVYYEVQGGNPPADVLLKLAKALGVSPDVLLGQEFVKKSKQSDAPHNLRLMRKLRLVEKLPEKERKQVLALIEALVENQQLKKESRA
ncbi:MAG: helix-turn-helix domain-containing protein [Deltaproteobacteria bacterium]|nr:helix-turn-helix domain-containing protein [Deltaproteobacteria bacterium]